MAQKSSLVSPALPLTEIRVKFAKTGAGAGLKKNDEFLYDWRKESRTKFASETPTELLLNFAAALMAEKKKNNSNFYFSKSI